MQVYSNGLSEVMLGKAIKELKLPREELVIMTKARLYSSCRGIVIPLTAEYRSCSELSLPSTT